MPNLPPLRVADLAQNSVTGFDFRPDSSEMQALARQLGLSGLRKLHFAGTIAAQGRRDWVLEARLGVSVTQPCVVTLDPVNTRIDTNVRRTFLANWSDPTEEEVEMDADDSVEPLGTHIDPRAIMIEALMLALPSYPRKSEAELGEAVFTKPGNAPMRDEDARPFAGLAGLRDTLKPDR
jgi:uncharacterized metal-binding protein YceD (DUF177 family)